MNDSESPDQTSQTGGEPSRRGLSALAQIAQALGTREARQKFLNDPRATITGYDELPESLRSGLESMSEHELVVLARAHRMFDEAGYNEEIEDQFGGGRVSFF